MPGLENPGIQAKDVWLGLDQFTPALVMNPSNNANWISMHNITGAGVWISMGHTLEESTIEVQVRYNIDGAGAVTDVISIGDAASSWGLGLPLFFGFSTSLIVEMRLSGIDTAFFQSVAIVE